MPDKNNSNDSILQTISLNFGDTFQPLIPLFEENSQIFETAKSRILPLITNYNGQIFFDYEQLEKAKSFLNVYFFDDAINRYFSVYTATKYNIPMDWNGIPHDLEIEIKTFSNFIGPYLDTSLSIRQQKEKDYALAIQSLKESIISRPLKKFNILKDWLTKWSIYLKKETAFSPAKLKTYKQGEIILVDFGFNIGAELGGRHYALVIEKNNNPRSAVILVAPISSYDPEKNEHAHPASVDLGVGAIHNYAKGSQVVLNQIRYISKMRIERPKTSLEKREYVNASKLQEVLNKIHKKIQYKATKSI